MNKKAAVILGSDSDLKTMSPCLDLLRSFGIPFEVRIISAHRTPAEAEKFAAGARENGFGVLIAAAGKSAHLAGVLAAYTTLPVIGVPIQTSLMGGLDSLLSMVQMPKGVPVACVAVDGAENAAILAVQILAQGDPSLDQALSDYKAGMERGVREKDQAVRSQFGTE